MARLGRVFNRAAFDERSTTYQNTLSSPQFGVSPAYSKLEVIFGLYKLRSREMERLDSLLNIGRNSGEAADAAAEEEKVRLDSAQEKLLLGTDFDVAALLTQAKAESATLNDVQKANLRECEHLYRYYSIRSDAATSALFSEQTRLSLPLPVACSGKAWTLRRRKVMGRPGTFQKSHLQAMLDVRREIARRMAEAHGGTPYEAIMGEWMPGMPWVHVKNQIERMHKELPGVIADVKRQAESIEPPLPLPSISVKDQMALYQDLKDVILEEAGWSKEKLAAHGIRVGLYSKGAATGGSATDVRIGLDTDKNDLMKGLISACHETGHALVFIEANNWDKSLQDQPVADVLSLASHEGVSTLLERAMKRPEFFEKIQPLIEKHWGENPAFSAANLYKQSVWPKFDSPDDWWTNDAMRAAVNIFYTEAEQKLIDGEMELDEVPAFYQKTMQSLIGSDKKLPAFYDDGGYWLDKYQGYYWSYVEAEPLSRSVAHDVEKSLERQGMLI